MGIVVSCLLSLLYCQSTTSSTEEFLNKIKEILKNRLERTKSRKGQNISKNRAMEREKTRKRTIQKLSNPYIRFSTKPIIIKLSHQPKKEKNDIYRADSSPQDSHINNITSISAENNLSREVRYIANIFNKFPYFNLPSLNALNKQKILKDDNKSFTSGISDKKNFEMHKEEIMLDYIDATLSTIYKFWSFVANRFFDSEEKWEYIIKSICPGEININIFNGSATHKDVFKPDFFKFNTTSFRSELWNRDFLLYFLNNVLNPLMHKSTLTGARGLEIILYPIVTKNIIKNVDDFKSISIRQINKLGKTNNSFCYELTLLNVWGLALKELIYECSYFKDENSCIKIPSYFKLYFKAMNRIFVKKAIPAYMRMCIEGCLCNVSSIVCNKTGRDNIADDNFLMVLYNILYKELYYSSLEDLEIFSYANTLADEYKRCILPMLQSIDKMKDNLLDLIDRKTREKSYGVVESILKVVKEEIKEDRVKNAFEKLYNSLPLLLIDILKSQEFQEFFSKLTEKVKDWTGEIKNGIEKKDKCFLEVASVIGFSEVDKSNGKKAFWISFLSSKNLDGWIKGLQTYIYSKDKILGLTPPAQVLAELYTLKAKIYVDLTQYKALKCYFKKDENDLQMEELLQRIKSYECILENDEFKIECYLKGFFESFSFSPLLKNILEEIIKSLNITLMNIENKCMEIANNGIKHYKAQIKESGIKEWLCADAENIWKINEILEFLRNDYFKIVFTCYPEKCNGKNCLDIIKAICPVPLLACNSPPTIPPPPHICIKEMTIGQSNTIKMPGLDWLVANSSHPDFLVFTLAYQQGALSIVLNSLLLKENQPQNSCQTAISLYEALCKALDFKIGDPKQERIEEIKRTVEFCKINFQISPSDVQKRFEIIKFMLSENYLQKLKEATQTPKIKILYSKFKNNELCD